MLFARKLCVGLLAVYATASVVVMLSAACVTGGKEEKAKDELNASEQKKLDEYRAELEVGRNMAGRLLQFYGTQNDSALLGYVNQIGAYVGSYSDTPDQRLMFEILDSDMVNAFACPGGYILLTMGAIRHARNEAELAAVIGHEAAHVGKKHMFDKLKNMSEAELQKANEIANREMKQPPEVRARKRPEPQKSDIGDALAKYLSGGAAGLNIVKAAGAGMAVMLEQGLGAEKEYEADFEGVKYAIRAGYAPTALADYLCRLENKKEGDGKCVVSKASKKKGDSILDKTHPPVAERIANIDIAIDKLDAKQITGATGQERFARAQSRMPKEKVKK